MVDFTAIRWAATRGIATCALVFFALPPLRMVAQDSASPGPAVTIPVVAYDKKGQLIGDLKQDDFVLQVDRKPASISGFTHAGDSPTTFGLVVDTTSGQKALLAEEKTATAVFLNTMIGSNTKDNSFVIQFSRQIDLLQDTTSSGDKIQAALRQLTTSDAPATQSVTPVSETTGDAASQGKLGDALLYDAVFLASDELMSRQQGRKVLIVLSDGADAHSKETLGSAIEAAKRTDTIVYAIYFRGNDASRMTDRHVSAGGADPNDPSSYPGSGYPGGGYPGGGYPGGYPRTTQPGGRGGRPDNATRPDGRKTLERMADETGGRLFEVSRSAPLADIYKEIAAELSAQYRLQFTPAKEDASDGFHRIVLTTKNNPKEIYLQTRDGYYIGD